MSWTFNQQQLASWPEARELVAKIEAFRLSQGIKMGGGVLPETKDMITSGIYVPTWNGGPAGFPEPNDAGNNRYWLHFRFANGRSGVNVGLIVDGLRRYNGNEMYIFTTLNNNDLS